MLANQIYVSPGTTAFIRSWAISSQALAPFLEWCKKAQRTRGKECVDWLINLNVIGESLALVSVRSPR